MTERRIVTFANSAVALEWVGADAGHIVEFLFRDLPADPGIIPHRTYRIRPGDGALTWTVDCDAGLACRLNSAAELADWLLGDVSYHLVDKSSGGLVLHAAALAWRGRGVMVAGGIGSGKSTLTAWLVSQGLDYLTDEMVFVPDGTETLVPLARPLCIKRPARPALAEVFDFEKHTGAYLSVAAADLIPANLLHPDNVQSTPRLACMLFPRFQSGGDGAFERVTKARAGLALASTLVNARNLSEQGIPQVARIARSAPAVSIRYGHFDQIRSTLSRFLTEILDGETFL